MIPQERVNEGYAQYQKSTYYENPSEESAFKSGVRFAEAELNKPTTSPDVQQNLFNYFAEQHDIQLMLGDFHEIENYMKPEVQQRAMEFAEWFDTYKYWNYSKSNTTSELFAKFEAERSEK